MLNMLYSQPKTRTPFLTSIHSSDASTQKSHPPPLRGGFRKNGILAGQQHAAQAIIVMKIPTRKNEVYPIAKSLLNQSLPVSSGSGKPCNWRWSRCRTRCLLLEEGVEMVGLGFGRLGYSGLGFGGRGLEFRTTFDSVVILFSSCGQVVPTAVQSNQ